MLSVWKPRQFDHSTDITVKVWLKLWTVAVRVDRKSEVWSYAMSLPTHKEALQTPPGHP